MTIPKLSELMDHHRNLCIQYEMMERKVTAIDRAFGTTRYKYLIAKGCDVIEAKQAIDTVADMTFPLSLKIELHDILNSTSI